MLQHRDDIWPRAERWFGLSPQTTYVVPIVLALLYVLSIVFVILYFVEPERRLKMLLPLVCVLFSLAPLLVANPIGARCTFLAYAFMIVFTADLFGYICGHIPVLKKPISGILVVTVLVQLLMFLRIFYPIHYYDSLRLDFVREQAAEGKTTVLICDLPNSEYLWNSSPSYGNLIERYKRFHKLPENLEFEFIPFNELEQIANREPK
jgi:hypothetical protein